MFNYDKNRGCKPSVNDRVVFCHTDSDLDGMSGVIGGWSDSNQMIAIVILDVTYLGNSAITMPVVCCNKEDF